MTDLAKEYPTHAGPTILGLNFEGFTNYDGAASSMAPYASPTNTRDADIQEILYRTAEMFAPFNVEVRRVTDGDGKYWGSDGATTVFVGASTKNIGPGMTPGEYTDYPGAVFGPFGEAIKEQPNSDPFDLAFVDAAQCGSIPIIVQTIAHEAGHTFGLAHIRTVGTDPYYLGNSTNPEVMSYDSPKTFFQNSTFQITAYNNNPASGLPELTGTIPHWTYYEPEVFPWGVIYVPHENDVKTQNSFTYLTQVLGERQVGPGQDDVANVAHTGSVSPGWWGAGKDGTSPNVLAWSSTTGTIERMGDYDVFQFTATTSNPIVIGAQASSGSSLNPVLMAFDQSSSNPLGTQVSNDISPTNNGSLIAFTPQAGNTYQIVVGGADGNSSGAYQLQLFNASISPSGVLTVWADANPANLNDEITLDLDSTGTNVTVDVNGTTLTVPAVLTGIVINAGGGNDVIKVQATPAGIPVTVNSGAGNDVVVVGKDVSPHGASAFTLDQIQGPLAVHGDGQAPVKGSPPGTTGDFLFVEDTGTTAGQSYTITPSSVARNPAPTINYDTFEHVELDTGSYADTVTVAGTPSLASLTVSTGGGVDTIAVQNTAADTSLTLINGGDGPDSVTAGNWVSSVADSTLDGIQGPLTVDGQGLPGETDKFYVQDGGAGSGRVYYITASTVDRQNSAQITYQNMEYLEANTTDYIDHIAIHGTAAGTATVVNTGGSSDVIFVGNNANTLDGILGALTVNGGAPDFDQMVLYDKGIASGQKYTLTSTAVTSSVQRLGVLVSYSGLESVSLYAGDYDDTFTVVASPVKGLTPVTIYGDKGSDWLNGPNMPSTWNITANDEGNINSLFFFQSIESLMGGTQDDRFVFGNGVGVSGYISGGYGTDTLDYSAYDAQHPVTVNLQTNAATGVGLGLFFWSTENVIGGAGNDRITGNWNANNLSGGRGDDILIGSFGDDVLDGGIGRDLLIGGYGKDQLFGGPGEDILIAGYTDYDADLPTLEAVMKEWTRTDLDTAKRIAHLDGVSGGYNVVNGSVIFFNKAIHDDTDTDVLTGGDGADWFWCFAAEITDLLKSEDWFR
jgi:hypothetical protein